MCGFFFKKKKRLIEYWRGFYDDNAVGWNGSGYKKKEDGFSLGSLWRNKDYEGNL